MNIFVFSLDSMVSFSSKYVGYMEDIYLLKYLLFTLSKSSMNLTESLNDVSCMIMYIQYLYLILISLKIGARGKTDKD